MENPPNSHKQLTYTVTVISDRLVLIFEYTLVSFKVKTAKTLGEPNPSVAP